MQAVCARPGVLAQTSPASVSKITAVAKEIPGPIQTLQLLLLALQ